MNLIAIMEKEGLIKPPKWLSDSIQLLCYTGSVAYGCSTPTSDIDLVGICIPPKEILFPTTVIPGYDSDSNKFDQFLSSAEYNGKYYDITIYNITKYIRLLSENNPNICNVIYSPIDCILYSTQFVQPLLDNRDKFLSKKCYYTHGAYSKSQLKKMANKVPEKGGKRYESYHKYGYDLKFATHLIRLQIELIQILHGQTVDLRKASDLLKYIRTGNYTERQIRDLADQQGKGIDELMLTSKLREKPDEQYIRSLLLNILESYYGNLDIRFNLRS